MFEIILVLVLVILYYSYKYAWWRKKISDRQPRILMYHMIQEHRKDKFNGLRVTPEMFEKQISYLHKKGYKSFYMSELNENFTEKSIFITFDDGYKDNYLYALPILKKYGFKATLYLINDRHDRDWSVERKSKNNGGELKNEVKLSDENVQMMIESKVFELQPHTMRHKNFFKLNSSETREEIEKSKKDIEEKFSINCESFAYPFGIYKEDDWKIVKDLGFKNAVTTNKGISYLEKENIFLLKRITVSGKDNFLSFILKLRTGKRGLKK